jgi:hypothetical protein
MQMFCPKSPCLSKEPNFDDLYDAFFFKIWLLGTALNLYFIICKPFIGEIGGLENLALESILMFAGD